jgi:16S rRNA C1402 N4-methylase RsmH
LLFYKIPIKQEKKKKYFVKKLILKVAGYVCRGVFLALRMFVNDELNEFQFALAFAEKILKTGMKCIFLLTQYPIYGVQKNFH